MRLSQTSLLRAPRSRSSISTPYIPRSARSQVFLRGRCAPCERGGFRDGVHDQRARHRGSGQDAGASVNGGAQSHDCARACWRCPRLRRVDHWEDGGATVSSFCYTILTARNGWYAGRVRGAQESRYFVLDMGLYINIYLLPADIQLVLPSRNF